MSEVARSRRPDIRLEPRFDAPAPISSASEDPLAELARLVGQEDPFRNTFRPVRSDARHSNFGPAASQAGQPSPEPSGEDADASYGEDGWHAQHGPEAHGSSHEIDRWSEAPAEEAYADGHYGDPYAAHEHAHGAEDYAAPPLTPDLWAEAAASDGQYASEHHGADSTDPSPTPAPRRPLAVLAAVLVLTGGGLAATFLVRAGASPVAQARSAPTIMAATGPNKIKPSGAAADSTPEDADSALLDKNGASGSGPVKVVNSEEQPTDLSLLPKAAAAPQGAAQSTSPFPEPKKVKTYLVRADGTMIQSGSTATNPTGSIPASPRPAASEAAAGASGATTDSPAPPAASPRASTPKTAARTVTTPKAPPTSIADLASGAGAEAPSDAPKPRQPASPGAAQATKPKPVEVADASASDAPVGSTGAFALQLAAAPSEEDARSIFARLQKKYSGELGSFKPTIRKAESGGKSVYRVRVGNLSQDQAKSLCAKMQAGGGPCFVVHN